MSYCHERKGGANGLPESVIIMSLLPLIHNDCDGQMKIGARPLSSVSEFRPIIVHYATVACNAQILQPQRGTVSAAAHVHAPTFTVSVYFHVELKSTTATLVA
jgi:hypothetical protein